MGPRETEKLLCTAKDTTNRIKWQHTKWENPTSNRALIAKIYKETPKPGIKKTDNPILKWSIELNRWLSKDGTQVAEKKHLKKKATMAKNAWFCFYN